MMGELAHIAGGMVGEVWDDKSSTIPTKHHNSAKQRVRRSTRTKKVPPELQSHESSSATTRRPRAWNPQPEKPITRRKRPIEEEEEDVSPYPTPTSPKPSQQQRLCESQERELAVSLPIEAADVDCHEIPTLCALQYFYMFVDEHAQCGCESTRQSLAFLTNATDTLQAVLAETLDLQNLLAFQSLLLADRSSRLLSNILRDSPTTHPSFYHLTVNLAIWSLIPRIPSEPSLDGTESQNSEQSRCPSIPTSFHNLCMVQLLPLSRHGKDAWVECTTVVYHFGARILETIQNLAKRDAAASGDLPQGENGNEENLDAQEKEGQGEGDIFRFDFLSQFWTSFLNGIVKMEQDETVIVAVENLTIVQTFEIVRPSTNPHGRPSRKNLLCLGYQFKCGDGSVAIVKVS